MSVFSKVYEEQIRQIREREDIKNLSTSHFLTTMFYSMIIGSFSYEGDIPKMTIGLPDYIEENLFYGGVIAYFEENGEGQIALATPAGRLLKNGLYSQYNLIFRNGEMVIKNIEEIELCYNNFSSTPSVIIANEIIEKCYNALRSIDTSLIRASFPDIYALRDETKINSITDKISKAYNYREPYALISGDWSDEDIKKLTMYDNKATDILALWDIFVRYKNLGFTTFGVENIEISKNERLTKKEGESNTEITRYGLFFDMYSHRKDWLERIKTHFNKNIKLIINRNSDTIAEIIATMDEKVKMYEMMIAPYREEVNNEKKEEEKNNDGTDI